MYSTIRERGHAGLGEIIEIGPIAQRALRNGAVGEVRAAFERSLYLTLNGAWVCLGAPTLGSGPLNALVSGPACAALRQGLGAAAEVAGDRLLIGTAALSPVGARQWSPPPPPAGWTVLSLCRGLDALDALAVDAAPADGLAVLLKQRGPARRSAIAAAAEVPAAALAEWVSHAVAAPEGRWPAAPADALLPLIGFGPGLTPSGDDLAGGAMVALGLLGYGDMKDAIWAVLCPALAERTNAISIAHLSAAAEGFGAAALHRAINALLGGATQRLHADLAAIAAIGHTSGWDALAGAVIVLRAHRDAFGLGSPR